jgi:IS5 family transposase
MYRSPSSTDAERGRQQGLRVIGLDKDSFSTSFCRSSNTLAMIDADTTSLATSSLSLSSALRKLMRNYVGGVLAMDLPPELTE